MFCGYAEFQSQHKSLESTMFDFCASVFTPSGEGNATYSLLTSRDWVSLGMEVLRSNTLAACD
ncbi:hypothetical protein FDUTEX481_07723 [Tolypothrix sp. PCC 7601]|nr:hypothetical protein FDUTEX481_07723 [Tolypothrix sp. PCC 7601]BAY88699.1 hypothetical protein NIES3275_06990 [Microchaete diplosiphon NIES-3275]